MTFLINRFIAIALFVLGPGWADGSSQIGCSYNERQEGYVSLSIPRENIIYKYVDCVIDHGTAISTPDTKFSNQRNESVTNIVGIENKGIKYLPQDISDVFPNVKDIRISGTSLSAITKSNLHDMTKVQTLNLDHNEIASIGEDAFDDLVAIYRIELSNNKLTSLPPKLFSKLSTLDTLHLASNLITSLHPETFKNNNNLALLFLDDNKFTTFDPKTFETQTKMRQIWLHKNQIASLNSEWFRTCESLVDINLSDNKFSEIPLDFTSDLSSLREASFSRNPLTSVDFKLFEKNSNIYMIYFNGLKLKKVLNVDVLDKLGDLRGLYFNKEDEETCLEGEFHEGNLNELKEKVKTHCKRD
jgi:Leucine-rich repeat (LRR) protein